MSAADPGWHPDPAGAGGTYRWWDGEGWTRWLSRDADALAPTELSVEPGTPGGAVEATAPATGTAPARTAATAEPAVPVFPAAAEPLVAEPPVVELPTEPLVRVPVAVAVVLGTLLVALVAVGVVASASAQRLPSGPALAPPARTEGAALRYDATSRVASVGGLRVTLPGTPYVCDGAVDAAQPTFTTATTCNALVHRDYDKQRHDWTATVVVGVLPSSMVVTGDLQATADKAFASARRQFFSGDPTSASGLQAQPIDLGAQGKAVAVFGQVHYRIKGLPSRYDRLLVLVVPLADGTHAVVVSSRPNDSGATVLKALDGALDSVAVR